MAGPITSLRALDGANFRTSKRGDGLNDLLQQKLGLKYRYEPARLAIARSLEMETPPAPLEGEDADEHGKTILGRNLFGDDELALWLALIIERAGLSDPSLDAIQEQVRRHWHRGVILLTEEWGNCGGEYERFVLQLAERAGVANTPGKKRKATAGPVLVSAGTLPVVLELGTDPVSKEPVKWLLNGRGGSPHVAIMGTLGTGKTRTAMKLVQGIHRTSSAPVILFDMAKGDLAADKALVKALGAKVVSCPNAPVPLDMLALPSRGQGEVTNASMRFRDSFTSLSRTKPGGVQRDYLRDAAMRALSGPGPVTISDIGEALKAVYSENRRKSDAMTATFNDLNSWTLFEPRLSPGDFFRQSWVIDVHEAPETAQRFVVFLILDALYTYSKSLKDSAIDEQGHRELRLVVGIDEARRVLGYGQQSLIGLVRDSRSKGVSIFLLSQSPDDYDQEEDNFLENVGLAMCFKTNATSSRALRAWLGQNVDLGALPPGVAVTRLPGHSGVTRVQAWQ